MERLKLSAEPGTLATLRGVADDVLAGARVADHAFEEDASLEAGEISVSDAVFAPKPEKPKKG